MDVDKYLRRIGAPDPAGEPSLELLRSLHLHHLLSVPFENLTVHSGGRVQLELPLLYDKVVKQRRGGFCYENNSLFAWLLRQLGFRVTLLSGQVKNPKTRRYGPPFDHLLVMVIVEGRRWLCDVGFGAPGFSSPLSLETRAPQEQGHRVYRLREDGDLLILEWQGEENRGEAGLWSEIYKFTLEPRRLEDFEEMCRYHQSSPSSLFYCKSLCMMLKPGGRLSYIGYTLTSTRFPSEGGGGVETSVRELTEEEIPAVLQEHFGIVLQSPLRPKNEAITPPPPIL